MCCCWRDVYKRQVETLSIAGIKAAERQMKIFDMSVSGDVAAFAAELKSAL